MESDGSLKEIGSRCLEEAHAFFEDWSRHPEMSPPSTSLLNRRLREIEGEIHTRGTYSHRKEELEFGARLAWKNSNRCIGRHLWRSLEVRDCRATHLQSNREASVVDALKSHLAGAHRNGKIKSIISIFAPRVPDQPDPVRMANHQLIRYAGFQDQDAIIGDPDSVALTNRFLRDGWKPVGLDPFTLLPWQFYWEGWPGRPFDVFRDSPELATEVMLEHPENAAFAGLGLRWYALPVLADMALKIGGVVYPFAPFNGFYMGTEIGARNLADTDRYNMLPAVARCFELDASSERTLWKDRALVELNRAVLHSFDQAGITIGDHHNLGAQFEAFCQHESQNQREIHGDWSWLNPPLSSPQTPQFHREYANHVCQHTNFFYQSGVGQPPKSEQKCPFHL